MCLSLTFLQFSIQVHQVCSALDTFLHVGIAFTCLFSYGPLQKGQRLFFFSLRYIAWTIYLKEAYISGALLVLNVSLERPTYVNFPAFPDLSFFGDF